MAYQRPSQLRVSGQGVARAGLLGFCDPAPGEAKALRVRYLWRRAPYAATVADQDGGGLPARGRAVTEPGPLAALAAAVAAQGLPAPGADAPAGWADNALYTPRASADE